MSCSVSNRIWIIKAFAFIWALTLVTLIKKRDRQRFPPAFIRWLIQSVPIVWAFTWKKKKSEAQTKALASISIRNLKMNKCSTKNSFAWKQRPHSRCQTCTHLHTRSIYQFCRTGFISTPTARGVSVNVNTQVKIERNRTFAPIHSRTSDGSAVAFNPSELQEGLQQRLRPGGARVKFNVELPGICQVLLWHRALQTSNGCWCWCWRCVALFSDGHRTIIEFDAIYPVCRYLGWISKLDGCRNSKSFRTITAEKVDKQ